MTNSYIYIYITIRIALVWLYRHCT